ncbi:MAG: putative flippase GtrA [Sphingobacteriales bacterium]|jgi:putative flippase GtrA
MFRLLFRRFAEIKLIRYFFTAGMATVVDFATYFVFFQWVFKKENVPVFGLVLSGPIAALVISYSVGLIVNFTLTKILVFNDSDLRTRTQFLRYLLVAFVTFWANYFVLKALIEYLDIYPTPSRMISAILVAFLSFSFHKVFTFKVNKPKNGNQ